MKDEHAVADWLNEVATPTVMEEALVSIFSA